MKKVKLVSDPVHGLIELNDLQSELMGKPEVQRLAWIRQLGLSHIVFPGANHSRLEHDLGVSFIAGKIAEFLKLPEKEKFLLQAAGVLHDLGHTPFSHTLESLLPKNHMQYAENLITGKEKMNLRGAGKIPGTLEKYGLKPKEVADLINKKFKGKKYLQSIIFGEIDADQLDYLQRDAHYTGVSHGVLDAERIIKTMVIKKNELCILEKGVDAVEEMLVARDHMFSSVYLHHTARIAEMMLLRAVETAIEKMPDFYEYIDGQLLEKLREANDYSKDIAERIITRNLFKRAFELTSVKGKEKKFKQLIKKGHKEIEEELCEKIGIKKGYVIVDLPVEVLEFSEPRIKEIRVKILRKNGSIADMSQISTIAQALLKKVSSHSLFSVYTPAEFKEKLGKTVEQFF